MNMLKLFVAALFFLPSILLADEVRIYKEVSAWNGHHEMVLSTEPCPIEENHDYLNLAYVTDTTTVVGHGCWMDYGEMYDIWIPALMAHFQLYKHEFKPRGEPISVEPKVAKP